MTLPTPAPSSSAAFVVRGLIPTGWRHEIVIVEEGAEGSKPWVEIGVRSSVAQHQAEICIGPFADNEPSDWRSGWTDREGWCVLRVRNPSAQIKPRHAIEDAAWFEASR